VGRTQRRRFVLAAVSLAAAPIAHAQPVAKLRRIGYLSGGTQQGGAANLAALIAGLDALGWKEGRKLTVDVRYAETRMADLPGLAVELTRLRPEVIVGVGPAPALALKQASAGIPVVFATVADPIGLGLAKTLAHPEGEFTGLATLAPEYVLAKQIELIRETVPRAKRIAFLVNPDNPVHVQGRERRLAVAKTHGLEAVEVEATTREGLERAFAEAARQKADVMYLSGDPLPLAHRAFVAELALRHRLPVMFLFHQHVDAGGLMSYGVDQEDQFRRAAGYVDRILKGAKPQDLPIEEPTKYVLVINLKTARALGVPIPPAVRLRADRLIE
jgi:putative ABC transport system substrate-binding protein